MGGESVLEASSLVWKEEESRASTKSLLIGKVLTEKTFVHSMVLSEMQKAGNMEEGLRVIDVWKNVFIFVIDSKEECRRILRGHPWSIQGHLICLHEKGQYEVIDEIDFNSSPFRIELHDVPLEAMSVDTLRRFSTKFGRLVMIEDLDCDGLMQQSFLQFRAVVKIDKAQVEGFWIECPDGNKSWTKVK
ncbi:hypothetical protein QN277_000913 [Acacia crassicarpa]|uniref:DUF4283 domain-containing protein n=1 Tax=Acacia crassicarpa TaxID=499986 RepID=A0AAE1N610_9FABA|nr:hypothetical protein QN277_000913 [Acacia crassicarpa]